MKTFDDYRKMYLDAIGPALTDPNTARVDFDMWVASAWQIDNKSDPWDKDFEKKLLAVEDEMLKRAIVDGMTKLTNVMGALLREDDKGKQK